MRIATRKALAVLLGAQLFVTMAGLALLIAPAPACGNDQNAVLLDFYSDWCGACQSMAPAVEDLARAGYAVERINIDQDAGLARQYGVTSIPCFVVLQQGREIDRVTGVTTTERLKLKLRAEGGGRRPDVAAPHPAWRYQRPLGWRSAVVRIICQDGATTRSIGSGALVKWNGRLVVLTARHVVKDAQRILVELCTKATHRATVMKVDAVWDCAVLELSGTPEGVEPAEVELGDRAMQRAGDRLESCGYGPDGRLACNAGMFLSYRRSSETPQGPDDWLTISGHARGGDSGGPIFNARGRLVGVLWGTDGEEVVGVQAGRIHLLLDAAVPEQKALVAEQKAVLQRNPTPAKEPEPIAQQPVVSVPPCAGGTCCPTGSVAAETSAYGKQQPLIPWRDGAQKKDDALDARIEALLDLQERQARDAAANPVTAVTPPLVAPKTESPDEASPIVAAICMAGAIGLAAAMYFLTAKES